MIVQIYEISNPKEAKETEGLGVDHIGVLVGKGTHPPRELSYKEIRAIFDVLSQETKKVALSLSSRLSDLFEVIEKTHPDILHIGTSLEDIKLKDVRAIKKKFPNVKIMRAIPVINERSIEEAEKYEGIADYLLLDTQEKGGSQIGATGQTHDWSMSRKIVESVKIPVILAGGLGPDNVEEAIKTVKPAGVDSKTKTDRANGQGKDLAKVKEFVIRAKRSTTV